MDERLARLAVFGADDHDARRTAHLVLSGADPDRMEDALEHTVVFLMRYMRASLEEIESQSLPRLYRWEGILRGFLQGESPMPSEDKV